MKCEELETVLCDVEAGTNSRPLTYISEDEIEESLTLYYLMFGRNVMKVLTQNEDLDIYSQECSTRLYSAVTIELSEEILFNVLK